MAERGAAGISEPYVLGQVEDADGVAVFVGACNGTVTVGEEFPYRFTQEQAEEFGQLYIRACWEAARQDGAP